METIDQDKVHIKILYNDGKEVKPYEITMYKQTTIKELKEEIEFQLKTPAQEQVLEFNSRELSEKERTLEEYKITKQATIRMFTKS